MNMIVPPDLEALINKRLSSGAYADAQDVVRRALEAQDAEESWIDEERMAWAAHVDKGFEQVSRGEVIDGDAARLEIQKLKNSWRSARG